MRRLITAASVLAIFAAIAGPAAAKSRSVCPRVPRRGHVTCYALVQVHKRARGRHGGADVIASVVNPGGYHPADLQAAYGLASAAAKDGAGQTVAIVDAYNDPNAASNLATYRSTFGLPAVQIRLLHAGQPDRRQPASRQPTAAGLMRSRSTSTWSPRSARTARSCSSMPARPRSRTC